MPSRQVAGHAMHAVVDAGVLHQDVQPLRVASWPSCCCFSPFTKKISRLEGESESERILFHRWRGATEEERESCRERAQTKEENAACSLVRSEMVAEISPPMASTHVFGVAAKIFGDRAPANRAWIFSKRLRLLSLEDMDRCVENDPALLSWLDGKERGSSAADLDRAAARGDFNPAGVSEEARQRHA